jgi:hypothetical protein
MMHHGHETSETKSILMGVVTLHRLLSLINVACGATFVRLLRIGVRCRAHGCESAVRIAGNKKGEEDLHQALTQNGEAPAFFGAANQGVGKGMSQFLSQLLGLSPYAGRPQPTLFFGSVGFFFGCFLLR